MSKAALAVKSTVNGITAIEFENRIFVNVTPDPIKFLFEGNCVVEVPNCGVVIDGIPTEKRIGEVNGAELVKTVYLGDVQGLKAIRRIEDSFADTVLIIGNEETAKAYACCVHVPVPIKGDEQYMNPHKFMIF